jgi:hypothetical protein
LKKTLAAVGAQLALTLGLAACVNTGTAPRALATQDLERAIERGVAYFNAHQNPDGSFGADFKVAETSLALIAFGTSDRGSFQKLAPGRQATVAKAVAWLLRQQQPDTTKTEYGTFGPPPYITYDTSLAVSALNVSKGADPAVPEAIGAGRAALIGSFQGPSHRPPIDCSPRIDWIYCGGFNYTFEAGRSDEPNTEFGLYGLAQSGGIPADVAALSVGWQRNVQEVSSNPHARQNDGGGSSEPGESEAAHRSNANNTGSLLLGYAYGGVPGTDPGVQAALQFADDALRVYELTKDRGVAVYHDASKREQPCLPGTGGCNWHLATGDGGYHLSLWSLSLGIGAYAKPDLADNSNFAATIGRLLIGQQHKDGTWPQDGAYDGSAMVSTGFAIAALGLVAAQS